MDDTDIENKRKRDILFLFVKYTNRYYMLYQNMLNRQSNRISNSKISLLIIFLLVINSNVETSDTILSIECSRHKRCPFLQYIHCNRRIGRCQCKPEFPILLSQFSPCLNYRELGEECIHSSQCNKTSNAFCFDESNGVELNDLQNLEEWFAAEVENKYNKYSYRPENNGKCKCKAGHAMNAANECYKMHISGLLCDGSHQCMNWDLNSHCDRRTKRCTCDVGYFYDTDLDKCVISLKKLSDFCINDIECRSWDLNMNCRQSVCVCRYNYFYDSMTQRCKSLSTPRCKYGYEWNELSGECHNNRLHGSNPKFGLTRDRLLEMIALPIFLVILLLMIYGPGFVPRTHQRINSQRRSRTSSLGHPRVIHLRVNLESHDSNCLNEESVMNVSPNACSASSDCSLPPYEFSSGAPSGSQLSPYSDAPPTYEQAMALVKNQNLYISAKSDSK